MLIMYFSFGLSFLTALRSFMCIMDATFCLSHVFQILLIYFSFDFLGNFAIETLFLSNHSFVCLIVLNSFHGSCLVKRVLHCQLVNYSPKFPSDLFFYFFYIFKI